MTGSGSNLSGQTGSASNLSGKTGSGSATLARGKRSEIELDERQSDIFNFYNTAARRFPLFLIHELMEYSPKSNHSSSLWRHMIIIRFGKKLPYEPGLSVGWLVDQSVCHKFLNVGKFHFHAPIGARFTNDMPPAHTPFTSRHM